MVILCLHHQSDNHHIFRSFAGTKGILLHKNVYTFLDFVCEKEVKIDKDFFWFLVYSLARISCVRLIDAF